MAVPDCTSTGSETPQLAVQHLLTLCTDSPATAKLLAEATGGPQVQT